MPPAASGMPRVSGVVCALLLAVSLSVTGLPAAADDPLVLSGGTVYPGPTDAPISDGVVVIRDGKIIAVGPRDAVQVPEGAARLDCSGLFIFAGFWNNHVHFFERKWSDAANLPVLELAAQLQTMLTRYGFTSVYDLGSPWDNTRLIRERIESGEIPGPRIRSTGEVLIGKGWMPPELVLRTLGVMVFPSPEVEEAAGARVASKQLLESGTDGLKLFAAAPFPPSPTLPEEVIRAAVEEAHRRNKPVFAHPQTRDGLLAAVRAGVDVVAHTTPSSGPWDEALIAEMRKADVALIPTLKIWQYVLRHDRASLGMARAEATTAQLRAWLVAGGTVLFGTDVGGMDDYDPTEEYVLLARAGMSIRQILGALTTAPAMEFGEATRLGKIAPGFAADLVVLESDPAQNIRAFASVRYTLRDGNVIYSSAR